ncbi:unnamed protein product [Tilletia controversa]|nr:unnamed protein product [Tilletia controversa]
MRFSATSAVLTLLLARSAAAQAFFTADGPVQLVDYANFNREVVKIEKPVLAMFFAHWCGHCRNAAPEFLKAARSLDGIVKFAAIDCDREENRGKCQEFDVKGYPTIKLFPATKRRVPRDYQGDRKAQAFLDYAVEQLPLSAKKLQANELKPYLEKDATRPKVILLSTKTTSSPMFRSLALDFRSSHSFAYLRATDDPAHASIFRAAQTHLGLSDLRSEANLPALVLVRPGSTYSPDLVEKYEGQIKYRQVKAWLDSHHNSSSSSAPPPTPKAKTKTKAKKAKAAASKEKVEDVIPEGGTVEWRAQNLDGDKRAALEKLKKKAKDAAAKLAQQASENVVDPATDAASKAGEKIATAASDAASSAASAGKVASSKVSSAATGASSSAIAAGKAASLKAASASDDVVKAATKATSSAAAAASDAADQPVVAKVAAIVSDTVESVSDTLGKAANKVADAAHAAADTVTGSKKPAKEDDDGKAGDLPFESVEDVIMSSNADHLLDSLAAYLGEAIPGGAEAWKAEYGAHVEQARAAARDAILNAPNKEAAQQIALGAEKWLLESVQFDEEKLGRGEDSGEDEFEGQIKLSVGQKRKLNEMGKTLKKRIAAREAAAAAAAAAAKKEEKEEGKAGQRTHDEL